MFFDRGIASEKWSGTCLTGLTNCSGPDMANFTTVSELYIMKATCASWVCFSTTGSWLARLLSTTCTVVSRMIGSLACTTRRVLGSIWPCLRGLLSHCYCVCGILPNRVESACLSDSCLATSKVWANSTISANGFL